MLGTFVNAFEADMAAALGIGTARVEVTAVAAGSVFTRFKVRHGLFHKVIHAPPCIFP
jgi:hypothetical protein